MHSGREIVATGGRGHRGSRCRVQWELRGDYAEQTSWLVHAPLVELHQSLASVVLFAFLDGAAVLHFSVFV